MPSILMTNLHLISNTGSELHTVEVARHFANKGWDVTCFCLVCAEPILGSLRRAGVRGIDFAHMNDLESAYDVLFAQHRVVSECIWNHGRITFGKVVVSILGLSSVTKHEDLPYFFDEADLIVFVSEEARNAAEEAHGLLTAPAVIVPNYFTEEFKNVPAKAFPSSPKRIAVISNHIVTELAELEPIASERGIHIDFFGVERTSVSITPELMDSYDVIVTIGRTVPAALSLGIPVYCYDHFGGPGYITPANYEEALRFNFSGRNCPTHKEAQSLIDDIIDGWANVVASSKELQEIACERLCFSSLIEELESTITALAPSKEHRPHAVASSKSYSNLVECLEVRDQQLRTCRVGQVFYTPESQPEAELSEASSVRFLYRLNTEIEIRIDELVATNDQVIRRLDPMDGEACVCPQSPADAVFANLTIESPTAGSIFLTDDQIYVVSPCKRLSFSASTIDDTVRKLITREIGSRDDRITELESALGSVREEYNQFSRGANSRITLIEAERDDLMTKMHSIRYGVKNLAALCRERLLRR